MADFGAQLREARERKGISLRQIAAATKISIAALEALERNDISKLPGGIFTRAFVRSYAVEVGLDPDETVRKFLAQFVREPAPGAGPGAPLSIAPAASSQVAGVSALESRARVPRAHVPAIGETAPDGDELTQEVEFESRQRMAGVVLKLVLMSLPIAVTILYLNSRAGSSAAREPAPGPAAEAVQPAPVPEAVSEIVEESSLPPPDAPETVTPAAGPRQVASSDGVTIELAPTSECWVQLTTDGSVALSRVLQPGEREAYRFARQALLQVGDAAACAFTLNGRAARPLGRPKQVREVTITPENYPSLLAAGSSQP